MARIESTMMRPGEIFGNENKAPMTNPSMGGQFGAQPNYKETPSDTPFAPQDVIPQLLEGPLFFNYMPNGKDLLMMLKSMIERYPNKIEGLDKTVTYDYIEQDMAAGQKISRISKATLPQANVSISYEEKGNSRTIATYWRLYGDYGLMDPILARSRLVTLDYDNLPLDQLMDMSGFQCAFVEPDAYMKYPVVTYMVNGMQPKSSGDIKSQMAKVDGLQGVSFSIEFTGFYTESAVVDKLGKSILENIDRRGLNPDNNEVFSPAIAADVEAAKSGFMDQINAIADNA